MIITKYPEEVENRLTELDKQIAKVYEEETPKNTATEIPFEAIAWRKLPTPYQTKGE